MHNNSTLCLPRSSLGFKVEGLCGMARSTEAGFRYLWHGARGSIGVLRGRWHFSCRIVEAKSWAEDEEWNAPHDLAHVRLRQAQTGLEHPGSGRFKLY